MNAPRRAHPTSRTWRALASAVAALAVVWGTALAGAGPSVAAPSGPAAGPSALAQGHLSLDKSVDGEDATSVAASDSFLYQLLVGCDDNDCVNAVLDDPLPAQLAGFTLSSARVVPATAGTLTLTGCEVGGPVTGDCRLRVGFTTDLDGAGEGTDAGIPAGETYRVELRLVVPTDLPATWAHNGDPVDNTATLAADNADTVEDTATVTVTIPIEVEVTASKDWTPATQQYAPGATSRFTIGGGNASNIPARSLVLTDAPAATDGATSLDAANPFTYLDFAGLCSPSELPAGADRVRVDVYAGTGGSWHWVEGDPAAGPSLPDLPDGAEVGGLRFTYTSTEGATIEPGGDAAGQCVEVTQRASNRTTGESLVHGATVHNTVSATLTVPDHEPVTDDASDALVVSPLTVVVQAGKTIAPDTIPAGGSFAVDLSARNNSNGPLTGLTIAEPADPSGSQFLSGQLRFDGFTSWTWPDGATAGEFTWRFADGSTQTVPLTPDGGAPAVPPAPAIAGFTVDYTGEIAQGVTAGVAYRVATDATMVPGGTEYLSRTNTIGVTGTNPAGSDTRTATDDVRIYHPEIQLSIDKTLRPTLVTPGGTVLSELLTRTAANSARVNPTRIVVEDAWDGTGDTAFWDAFRAREISFVQIPAGATLRVEYATGNPGSQTWTVLDDDIGSTGLYSADLVARLGATADTITGLRFTFTNPDGFPQGTIVKPNICFEAAAVLRSTGEPTAPVVGTASRYDNLAAATGEGHSGGLPVTGDRVTDDASADVISHGGTGGDGTGPGTLLAGKRWVQSNWTSDLTLLPSQSGSAAYTAHGWGVTVPGYDSVVLSDPLPGEEDTPSATSFQAFDLTSIRAIGFAQDPLLRWDTVASVELYDGTSWQVVPAPGGSWMNTTGFKGHTLTAAQRASTTGVRVTVVPNDSARSAATEPGRPAPGTGVASSAAARPFWLQWQLRNDLRVPGATNWTTATVAYNETDHGVVRNDFEVATTGPAYSADASDTVSLVDNVPGVQTSKTVSRDSVVVPYPGDVAAGDYPVVTFAVSAWNTSQARASYVRVSDPSATVTDAAAWSPDVFTGAAYDPATNPFERFTITGLAFSAPSMVARDASRVALWRYDPAGGTSTVQLLTVTQAQALAADALADVVGVSVMYQSADPAITGGLIPQGSASSNLLTMTLTTRLRDTLRSTGADTAGEVRVDNVSTAQSYDPVIGAGLSPNAAGRADVDLLPAGLDVTASKTITPGTILQTRPDVGVTITLGATDGDSTVAAESATISDTDTGFWDTFTLDGLGAVTLPAGADRVRVDVQVNDGATWTTGQAAGTASLPEGVTPASVTGIRFVFTRADGRPFSATAVPADWSAQAVLNVHLRPGVAFPGAVDDTVTTEATHRGYEPAQAEATDTVTLSPGTPKLDVRKDPSVDPKVVEPGTSVPWTLTFTNIGTSYLHVERLVDSLGSWLRYDGTQPAYASTGSLPTTGIAVAQPAADAISFTFPADAPPMAPGDSFTVTVGIILVPGLQTGQRATNSFRVETAETFATGDCVNTSGNAQGILTGLAASQCGTSNFVTPQAGPLLFGEKEVRGEIDGDLVDGASNAVNPSLPCQAEPGAFYRTVCVPYTTIGATDEWRIGAANTGTVPYSALTFVDVLPAPGDRLLATGSARGSAWRPVFDLGYGVRPAVVETFPSDGIPEGTTTVVEVTTATDACSPGSGWNSDPACTGATWTTLDSYTGDPAAITALRVRLDFSRTAAGYLPPGGSVHFTYRTTNLPWTDGDSPSADAVRPALGTAARQLAWNQTGVSATLSTTGATIHRAPEKSGVQLLDGSLAVIKTVSGQNAEAAPVAFPFDLACTVRGGEGGSVPVALGDSATLTVPAGGTTRLDGLPLGADCRVKEAGSVGDYGEAARSSVQPLPIAIRLATTSEDPVPATQTVSFDNRYDLPPGNTGEPPDNGEPPGNTGEPPTGGGEVPTDTAGTGDEEDPPPGDLLAFTGASGTVGMLASATALLVLGAGLVIRSRRPR